MLLRRGIALSVGVGVAHWVGKRSTGGQLGWNDTGGSDCVMDTVVCSQEAEADIRHRIGQLDVLPTFRLSHSHPVQGLYD